MRHCVCCMAQTLCKQLACLTTRQRRAWMLQLQLGQQKCSRPFQHVTALVTSKPISTPCQLSQVSCKLDITCGFNHAKCNVPGCASTDMLGDWETICNAKFCSKTAGNTHLVFSGIDALITRLRAQLHGPEDAQDDEDLASTLSHRQSSLTQHAVSTRA